MKVQSFNVNAGCREKLLEGLETEGFEIKKMKNHAKTLIGISPKPQIVIQAVKTLEKDEDDEPQRLGLIEELSNEKSGNNLDFEDDSVFDINQSYESHQKVLKSYQIGADKGNTFKGLGVTLIKDNTLDDLDDEAEVGGGGGGGENMLSLNNSPRNVSKSSRRTVSMANRCKSSRNSKSHRKSSKFHQGVLGLSGQEDDPDESSGGILERTVRTTVINQLMQNGMAEKFRENYIQDEEEEDGGLESVFVRRGIQPKWMNKNKKFSPKKDSSRLEESRLNSHHLGESQKVGDISKDEYLTRKKLFEKKREQQRINGRGYPNSSSFKKSHLEAHQDQENNTNQRDHREGDNNIDELP